MKLLTASSYENRLHDVLARLSRYFMLAVMVVGLVVLAGWQFDLDSLKRPVPGQVAMNPLTAIAFLCSGLAVLLFSKPRYRKAVFIIAFFLLALAVVKFLFLKESSGIHPDRWLFPLKLNSDVVNGTPNNMAPNTAAGFVFTALALLLATRREVRPKKMSNFLALLVFTIGLFPIIGYIYAVREFYGFSSYIPMALHTAVCFVITGLALMFLNSRWGFMKSFTAPYVGGIMARVLIPAVVVLPIAIGYIRLRVNQVYPVSVELGVAGHVTVVVIIFLLLVWYVTVAMNKADLERTQAEERLGQLNRELIRKNIFFNQTLDLLCTATLEGYFQHINDSFEKVLGYQPHELTTTPFIRFVHPDDVQSTLHEVEKLAAGGTTLNFENRYRCKNGEYVWLQWNAVVHENLLYASARNITAAKAQTEQLHQQTEQLEQVNRELDSFTYSVSHDLRAPLRGVHGYAQILQEDYGRQLDDEGNRIINNIMANASKMGWLIDDLLSFSRLGRRELLKSSIAMKEMVGNLIAEIRQNEPGRQLTFQLDPLPDGLADNVTIRQVWVNLISNAVKYTRLCEEARIHIGAEETPTEIRYFIRDNGVGFDMKYANKLFGVFQRLHTEEEFEGTGVGLAIVHRIITKHGGKVWAESQLNEGATFWFTLLKTQLYDSGN